MVPCLHMADLEETTIAEPRIRNVARGILVRNGQLLVIEVDDGKGRWWILPGGKQEFGETAEETVIRECREELRCAVSVGPCVMVREFVGPRRKEVVGNVAEQHSVELYFLCEPQGQPDLKPSEKYHREIRWMNPDALTSIKFFPKVLGREMPSILSAQQPTRTLYVGDAD